MKLNRSIYKILLTTLLLSTSIQAELIAQQVPGKEENIYFLVTFGKDGKTSWGDFYFYSIWFFHIPTDYKKPFYIRVYDPDCGGAYDEIQGEFNTKTRFSVYGGKGVDPELNTESQGFNKGDNYKGGNLLQSKIFGSEAKYDDSYYTFGPFNPTDGDFNAKWNKYVFKIVCEGLDGDDGNLYKYFLSSNANSNIPIEGANAFTYFYTFRMWNDFKSVAHIYPFIDEGVVSVRQENFDWDNDGQILVVSRYRTGQSVVISNEDDWERSEMKVDEDKEVGSSLDFQFHKRQDVLVKNNNVVVRLTNQNKESLKFFSSPIGGVPKYESAVGVKAVKKPPTK
jgi:hypothetical protein